MPKKHDLGEKKIPSVTQRLLHEICIDDISAALSATDLRPLLPFIIPAQIMKGIKYHQRD
jgi:hypothetical protein